MKLLFAGSECAPFFKTGGLGDVMGALPKTIAKTTDNDVRVVLPFFTGMAEEYKSQLSFVTSFYVKVGWRDQYCGVLKLEMDNVTYYLLITCIILIDQACMVTMMKANVGPSSNKQLLKC